MRRIRLTASEKKVALKIALSSFIIQAVALYSSEIFIAVFNSRYDSLGVAFAQRWPYYFKPTVFFVFLVAYLFQLFIMFVTLRPILEYLRSGAGYVKARLAALKLPWRIVIIQSFTWIIGTTAYFVLVGWEPESGLPYPLSVLLKLSVGFVGSLYNCVIANIHLLPLKRQLGIVDMKAGEIDHFARNKNIFITFTSGFLLGTYFIYYAWYALQPESLTAGRFPLLIAWIAYFILAGFGLSFASRYEFHQQLAFLKSHLERLIYADSSATGGKVQLLAFDELGELVALFNQFTEKFVRLLEELSASSLLLSGAVQNLSTTTKEVTSTSNMQAAAVKEVVSTMEDSNNITQSIGRSISEVTRIAIKTKEHVEDGTGLVHESSQKMAEIRKKNTDTIAGIRSLADKIRAIWDIVDIINAIVEQTRIIAFNASLEASTAGEAGRNFRIVAGEIKRLADSTNQSTNEIQSRITEIQKAANNLIVVSEEGTERIRQGHELSEQLHEVFSDILDSADISASSSENIEFSIRQQAAAFEQILVTMKEISRGIDNLVQTQQQTAQTAEALNAMATNLKTEASKFSIVDDGASA